MKRTVVMVLSILLFAANASGGEMVLGEGGLIILGPGYGTDPQWWAYFGMTEAGSKAWLSGDYPPDWRKYVVFSGAGTDPTDWRDYVLTGPLAPIQPEPAPTPVVTPETTIPAAVPEPATMFLLVFGLVCLAGTRIGNAARVKEH